MRKFGKIDISHFKEVLKDKREWISVVKITSETPDQEIDVEGASYKVEAVTVPMLDPCAVYVTQGSGIESPVRKGQCWIAGFNGGDLRQGFLLSKISDMKSVLHEKAREQNTVIRSERNKKVFISNNLEKDLAFENMVLGLALKNWLTELTDKVIGIAQKVESIKTYISSHTHGTTLGPSTPPIIPPTTTLASDISALNTLKSDPEINPILSDLGYIQVKGKSEDPPV